MLELIGLLVGVLVGILVPWTIPSQYSFYVAAGLLSSLDSALGGYCARLDKQFRLSVFLSGTIVHAAVAPVVIRLG